MILTVFLKILLVGVMIATVGVLALGLFYMLKEGEKSNISSNKMMQLRILFQSIAILIFSLLLFFRIH